MADDDKVYFPDDEGKPEEKAEDPPAEETNEIPTGDQEGTEDVMTRNIIVVPKNLPDNIKVTADGKEREVFD